MEGNPSSERPLSKSPYRIVEIEYSRPRIHRINFIVSPRLSVYTCGSSVWDPHTHSLQEELEKIQNRAARFVTGNYVFETGTMTGILGQLKWESLKKTRKDSRLILLYKGLKGKAIGVLEINTLWLFRYILLAKKRTKVVSFHRLSGTGMTSLIL